jgi:hypothetical protein
VDRGGHEIAAAQAAHRGADALDSAGHLVTEDDRHLDAAPERAIANDNVVEADPASPDRDPDLVRANLARSDVSNAQDFGRTRSLGNDGTHLFVCLVNPPPKASWR